MGEEVMETMYKYDSKGKLRVWKCFAEGNEVKTISGQSGGNLTTHTYEAEAKNVGRANETTAEQQAEIEVIAHYTHQKDNCHYRYSEEEALVVLNSNRIPRKVHNYKDHGHKLPRTCLSSVKYNGSRACVINGILHSKIGRPEGIKVSHLADAVNKLTVYGYGNFDAEVYAHGLPLQRIRSAWLKPVKTDKEIIKIANDQLKASGIVNKVGNVDTAINILGYNPNEDAPKLRFYIFDLPDTSLPFWERVQLLDKEFESMATLVPNCLEKAVVRTTLSPDAREALRDDVVKEGYEGLVHYDPYDQYVFNSRSYTVQKDKPRYDDEAQVIGVEPCKNGDGKLLLRAGSSLNNVQFKCMMKVSRRDGKDYPRKVEDMEQLVRNWITFSYEELSTKGVPMKPVGEMVRKCNSVGDPLE